MARSRELRFVFSGDDRDLKRAFKSIKRDTDSTKSNTNALERDLKRAFRSIKSDTASFGRDIGRSFGLAGVAVGAGLVVELKRSHEAYRESAKIGRQTNAVIESTGGAANVTAKDIDRLAQSMSKKSGIDDEVIQSGANVLLTFQRVRNEAGKGNDIFNQGAQAATDMSVALDKDLNSSAIMVGKALNDPLKGITALGRAGVQFTKEQKEQIKTLVEQGRTLDAQKIILRELRTEFGGSAAAQADGMDRMKVAVENVEEAIGKGLDPALQGIADEMTKVAEKVTPVIEKVSTRIGRIFDKDISLGDKFRLSGQEIQKAFAPLAREAKRAIDRADLGEKLSDAVEEGAPKIVDAFAAAAPRAAGAFVRAFQNAGPWGKLLTVAFVAQRLGAFRAAGGLASDQFVGQVRKRIGPPLRNAFRTSATSAGSAAAASAAESMATQMPKSVNARAGRMRSPIVAVFRGIGIAAGVAAGAAIVGELEKAITKKLTGSDPDSVRRKMEPTDAISGGQKGAVGLLEDITDLNLPGGDPPRAGMGSNFRARGSTAFSAVAPGGSVRAFSTRARTSLDIAREIAGKFGLRITNGYRTPAENRAANGVANSWHMRGTRANPGAVDMIGSLPNMKAASAYAAQHYDLAENLIHDAGSGLHLHLAFASVSGSGGGSAGGGSGTFSGGSSGGSSGPSRETLAARALKAFEGKKILPLVRAASGTLRGLGSRSSSLGGTLDAADSVFGRMQRRQDLTTEDLADPAQRATRLFELSSLSNFKGAQLGVAGQRVAVIKKEIRRYRKLINDLNRAVEGKKVPAGAKGRARARIKTYQGRIAELKAELAGLGESIEDLKIDIAELGAETAEAATTGTYEAVQESLALQVDAGVISQATADAYLAGTRADLLAGKMGPLTDPQRWRIMADARQATPEDTTAADLIAAVKELKAAIDENNDFARSYEQTSRGAAIKALGSMVNREIYGSVSTRRKSAGDGTAAIY